MELILIPLSFIGDGSVVVVELAVSTHHVVFPVSCVVSTVSIVKFSFSVALAVLFVAKVLAAVLVLLLDVLADGLLGGFGCFLGWGVGFCWGCLRRWRLLGGFWLVCDLLGTFCCFDSNRLII